MTFRSALVPPYLRKTKSLEVALHWLYLESVSTDEMNETLAVLVGPEAKGLSARTVSRLKKSGRKNMAAGVMRVCKGADGCMSWRAEQTKPCSLVVVGMNEGDEKRFLAIEDGVRRAAKLARSLAEAQVTRHL